MKKRFSVLVILLSLTFGTRQLAAAQSTPLPSAARVAMPFWAGPVVTLSASTDKQTYSGGEAIVLKIALTNRTTSYQYQGIAGSSSVFALFDFDVRDAEGAQVPFTAFGKEKLKRVLGRGFDPLSVFSLSIPPGKSLDYQVVLNRLFDMSRGGTYQITALWHDPSEDTIGQQNHKHPPMLVSNLAVVRVEEPDAEFYGDSNVFTHH